MAQHDYIIANQSGAAFRSDLNNGLAAIVSQNSGAAQPSTTYSYQWWADTTTGLLKIRNAANNAWITVGTLSAANLGLLGPAGGTLTGALLADDSGTAALPAIAFDGDPNTGIYSPGADQLEFSTGGVGRVKIAADGAVSSVVPGGSTFYPQFACRAWVTLDGTGTVTIIASGNVSSVTDSGTAQYTVNLTTAMPDANYAGVADAQDRTGARIGSYATGSFEIITYDAGLLASSRISAAIFR